VRILNGTQQARSSLGGLEWIDVSYLKVKYLIRHEAIDSIPFVIVVELSRTLGTALMEGTMM
jgi:hypothetical protein